MSRFIDYAIDHARLTVATLIFLLCAGLVAYVTIAKEAEPDVKIPVICGIWPLSSLRNAEFMINELRVRVPPQFVERMRRADNQEKARHEGVAIAQEMVAKVRRMVQGVQLSAPFGRYQLAVEVAQAIGSGND